ncbi:nucleoporin-interacting protein [Paenibacillus sp.]|uniref:nucleoporin-interacting protein n=1 Tax=Paenibacillus sp. TaxID=58172 RepID=UPI002D58A1F4|nr:nucleoporin-interacting protein [Paenibacillus sp.]HZG54890.1 nucleoporin-interacting protein [Paenibacillus sp.]
MTAGGNASSSARGGAGERSRLRAAGPFLAAAALAALLCAMRIASASPYAASWDAVDFALALDRFDLLAMQPHFPGYPFFVLAGMALRPLFGGDAVAALAGAGALAYASAVWPMYALARATMPAAPAALTAALLQGAAYVGLAAALPMSEAMAVGVLWWYLYAAFAALRTPRLGPLLWTASLYGVLLGVRLSYVAFGLLLAPLLLRELRASRLRAGAFLLAAALAQLAWIGGLAATEGSLGGFWQLALEFARGHFTGWGGAATAASADPLPERLAALLFYNWLWVGLCGGSPLNAAALGAAVLAGLAAAVRGRRGAAPGASASSDAPAPPASQAASAAALRWLAAACAAYFLWALFAQNVDKPRHILPLVGPALWLLAAWLGRAFGRRRALLAAALSAALTAQLVAGAGLLRTVREETPAVVQLHRYAEARLETPFILYTWEETRPLQYLGADYPHKRVYTYGLADEERRARPDRRAYVTGSVLEGFAAQGVDVSERRFVPLATFRSSRIVEPVYHEITIYEWR